MKHPPVEVLWCADSVRNRNHGWSFTHEIREKILKLVGPRTVLHLFGGRADFGTRLDIDPLVRPHVIGDAWLSPPSQLAT